MSVYERAKFLVAEGLRDATQKAFAFEVDPAGRPWAAHSPRTIRGIAMLRDTGAMFSSGSILPVASGVTISFDSPAGWHQSGTIHMPARRIVPDEGEADGLVERAFEQAIKELG